MPGPVSQTCSTTVSPRARAASSTPPVRVPGVSAEDCLYADLGIDPGRVGCQHLEATQFLCTERVIDTAGYLVLWQAAVVGDRTFMQVATTRAHRQLLVDKLKRFYPAAHEVTIYSRLAIALLAVVAVSLGYWGWRGRRTHRALRQLAQTDSLTGLSNRRHFRAQTEAALASSAQRGRPVSLLLLDLDHFKQINDQCGHAAGDRVLREVARIGRLQCREADLCGRIGGEEFALTLVDCGLEDAMHVAEQCRRAIAGIDAREAGCMLPVSVSVGCVCTSLSGYDYEVLVAHADAAMYRSKVGGRNRVSVYQPAAQAAIIEAQGEHAAAEVV
jgi:diguanylate cyclase (GGDEF)-like protein